MKHITYISIFFLGKCNTHLSKSNKGSSESNETLSVYDGVTVKIEYISEDDDDDSKHEDLASSKELLLSLEERKKVAASVTTIPLRQPLSANYKSSMITSVSDRTNSFTGKWLLQCSRYSSQNFCVEKVFS